MKALNYLGLAIFVIGIILFFLREFTEIIPIETNEFWIDIMWPAGLMLYGITQIGLQKDKNKS